MMWSSVPPRSTVWQSRGPEEAEHNSFTSRISFHYRKSKREDHHHSLSDLNSSLIAHTHTVMQRKSVIRIL